MEIFPHLTVKTTNKHIGHYIRHYVHVPGDCAGSSSAWWAGTALTGRCASAGGGVPSSPYMLATATWWRRRFETAWAYWEMRFSLALRKLRNGFIWNPFICGWMFHRSEGKGTLIWGAIPALVVRLYMPQQGSRPCVSLKPATSKELAPLFHLCVAVTDKGRRGGDDNELPRYHQTVITMVTAALCCCQSSSLIIPQQIPRRSSSTDVCKVTFLQLKKRKKR